MKNIPKIILAFFSLFVCTTITAQFKKYSVKNAHAHNDYLNARPFYNAYQNSFGSIEADVFSVGGILHVAHKKDEIKPGNTLVNLYIKPLISELQSTGKQKLNLLIDIKESYAVILPLLDKELEPLKQYLSTLDHPGLLTILITGNRPPPALYKNYADYYFFDDDLKLKHTQTEWNRVGLVSLPFARISAWKGNDRIIRKDKKLLKHKIDSVHSAGKPIRFWAAPDNGKSWKLQKKLHADFIGTDKVDELAKYLRR